MKEVIVAADGSQTVIDHPDVNPVPPVITAVQGVIALRRSGLLSQVDSFVAQANGETRIWWEKSTEWHRNSPVLTALGSAMNLSSEQIDDLFRLAGSIG